MAIKRNTKVLSEFSMSSMTDIVFLLLIFFLVTSTLVNPNALKLLLPKSTGQVSAKATVSVSIKHYQETGKFTYHINGEQTPVRFDQIEGELNGLLMTEEDPTFSIYSDETVPIGEVVKLMNIAKRNHYKVILATSPE
ncbi:MAG: biopolymer transporter ExbD [Bacteroidetes bacterium]|uniref:Biopolymer transporter ExbD n=1 Tax=Candidatus Cryptobacteroides merdigallinarum TaxID=2840770 RepID=A0A9D9ELQ9_9BACT|nr:biopolymer transporter ExbD [Candidatus Cryptobacteroides merdigallinarum]